MTRRSWIGIHTEVTQKRQCVLAGVVRGTVYAQRKPKSPDEADEVIKRLPGPNTSWAHPQHKVYPYLLRGVPVVRVNQVWSTDITYIRLASGFAYLVAIIDWYSRKVLSWRISNTMEAAFCVDCLEDALRKHCKPEVFNSDQGTQFTSEAFTGVLKREGVTNSMDGRGRAFDNIFVERLWRSVKHEDVYLNGYATMGELLIGLTKYFAFYNGERPHQFDRRRGDDCGQVRGQARTRGTPHCASLHGDCVRASQGRE